MRPWIKTTLASLFLAGTACAQNAAGVSVWLQLPKTPDLFAPARAQGADALILKLLGASAAKEMVAAQDGRGPLLHYRAAAWSPLVPAADRAMALNTLAADWGSALRVEEASAPSFLNGPAAAATAKAPTIDSVIGLVPSALLAGNHANFYDGFKAGTGNAEPVSGRMGTDFSVLGPATPRVVPAATKLEPPSPLAQPYEDAIEKAARASGIDPALLRAVVAAKSGYRADRASSGAYGLMGISARNAKAYGYTTKQILDPETNLKVGSDMLADLLKQFGGDVHRALAAFQAGPLAVLNSGGIPNDPNVKDFMNAVEAALGPQARAAQVPVKTIRSPLRYSIQKDLIELAEQARRGTGVSRYRPLIEKTAAQFGVDPRLMEAMVMQEDPSGDPTATSKAGARGLAQLMPDTAADLGVNDPTDPIQSLRGMARHIKHLSGLFNGNPVLIAASYNAGEGTVQNLGRVPRYKETMAYVRRVFNNYFTLTDEKIDVEPYMPPARVPAKKTPPLVRDHPDRPQPNLH